jgi:hypothetical protein
MPENKMTANATAQEAAITAATGLPLSFSLARHEVHSIPKLLSSAVITPGIRRLNATSDTGCWHVGGSRRDI